MNLPSPGKRFYRSVWRLFHDLVRGGYPANDETMALARRSIEKLKEH